MKKLPSPSSIIHTKIYWKLRHWVKFNTKLYISNIIFLDSISNWIANILKYFQAKHILYILAFFILLVWTPPFLAEIKCEQPLRGSQRLFCYFSNSLGVCLSSTGWLPLPVGVEIRVAKIKIVFTRTCRGFSVVGNCFVCLECSEYSEYYAIKWEPPVPDRSYLAG